VVVLSAEATEAMFWPMMFFPLSIQTTRTIAEMMTPMKVLKDLCRRVDSLVMRTIMMMSVPVLTMMMLMMMMQAVMLSFVALAMTWTR